MMTPLDYSRSFVCTVGNGNAPRFWVESRCRLFDDAAGDMFEFYQAASCKSEHTFARENLFQYPNYDFLPVFSKEHVAIFRRHAHCNANYVEYVNAQDIWGGPIFRLSETTDVKELASNQMILEATRACLPMVSQTEIQNSDMRLRAIIEAPVKTMNIDEQRDLYQVDTGIVLLPDLSRRYANPIESLRLAYVAFNVPHFAEFVIEQPTPISVDGRKTTQVYHYSGIQRLEARNRLFSMNGT